MSILIACVALPKPPTTPLCLFVNTYADKEDPAVKANPKLLGQVMPAEKHYFRCRNHKSTKFNIPVSSPSATNIVGTPYNDYVELNSYMNKVADIFTKEFLNKVGK